MNLTNFVDGREVRKFREKLNMNQSQFWSRVSVQQSASSRYEGGREIPAAVQVLLKLAYGNDKVAQAALTSLRK